MIVEVFPKDPLKDPLMMIPTDSRELHQAVEQFTEKIESINLTELIKMDFERGEVTAVGEITMKAGYTFADIEFPGLLGSIEVLKANGRTYTCFIQLAVCDKFLLQKMREFDLAVIWIAPMRKSRDLSVYTCIGDNANLNKVLHLMATYGEVRNVIFEEASFSGNDPLSRLTARQRDLLIAAKRYGYYEYPRRISGQELAEKLGISKATAIEHLRKAEVRLISTLLAGY